MTKPITATLKFIKCFLGFGSIKDGSICWFSENYWDIHDYHKHKGGDGCPIHWKIYKCPNCGKRFGI